MADPADLDAWLTEVASALRLPRPDGSAPHVVDRDAVLDLARDIAHGITRPAAPLTAYLAGIAVGRGADLQSVTATVARLTAQWSPPSGAAT